MMTVVSGEGGKLMVGGDNDSDDGASMIRRKELRQVKDGGDDGGKLGTVG